MRVGARAGPFSVSGNPSSTLGLLFTMAIVIAVLQAAVRYWYVTAAAVVVLGVLIFLLVQSRRARADEARRRERERIAAWIAAQPPPLVLPGRFTQTWLAENVPTLHPGQIEPLLRELRARGWKEDRIQDRVAPLISQNRSVWSGWRAGRVDLAVEP